MATQSSPPPASGLPDEKLQSPATDIAPSVNEVHQNANGELPKKSPPSVFVNSEPMREEQVQNAVKFLSHPKVRGSPVMYRRSFLEKKGLTKEEIDEAFRRVPDPPPSSQATVTTQEAQVKSAPVIQPSAQTQTLQAAAAAPTSVMSSVRPRYQFHWYHAVVAVGLLATSGAGAALLVKNTIIPRLKSWIRKVALEEEEEEDGSAKKIDAKPSLAEEAAAAAKAAAAAAADVAKASQEMLNSKNEEKKCFEEFMNLLDVQVKEMKSMGTAIRKLEGQNNNFGRTFSLDRDDYTLSAGNQSRSLPVQQTYVNGSDSRSGSSNPRFAPRYKPWEVGQSQNSTSQAIQSQVNGEPYGSRVEENGLNYLSDSESNVPWWQQKNATTTEPENNDQPKTGPVATQRTWVPPQPPPVAMAGAAEAIRRPKPPAQREQLPEDQPAEVTDELQRITKIAESGGELEYNGGASELSSSEIKEEQELGYAAN